MKMSLVGAVLTHPLVGGLVEISSVVCCHTSGCGQQWHRDYYTFSANCGHISWPPEQILGAIAEAWADVRQSPLHSVGFMMFSCQHICYQHRISNLSGYSGTFSSCDVKL